MSQTFAEPPVTAPATNPTPDATAAEKSKPAEFTSSSPDSHSRTRSSGPIGPHHERCAPRQQPGPGAPQHSRQLLVHPMSSAYLPLGQFRPPSPWSAPVPGESLLIVDDDGFVHQALESALTGRLEHILHAHEPEEGLRIKLVPDAAELESCRALGERLARQLAGSAAPREIDLAELAQPA